MTSDVSPCGKNRGLSTEPCGTPAVTGFQIEDWPFTTTLWCLFVIKVLIKQKRLSIPLFKVCKEEHGVTPRKLHEFLGLAPKHKNYYDLYDL